MKYLDQAEAYGTYLVLCGGVGGVKLALGLSRVLNPSQLTIVVNTGDDFEHLGLTICPDIDTVIYTLAGLVHPAQGWGRADESWQALTEVGRLGGATWFQLGDKDLGLHLVRRHLLDQGKTLSEVTARITCNLGVAPEIVPMSDQPVRTEVVTEEGVLPFQHYFVRKRCEPKVSAIRYVGGAEAAPSPVFLQTLQRTDLRGVIICPSNPFLSVEPILVLPGVREALRALQAPVIAVSPVVAGHAVKGPTAKIMQELSMEVSAAAVAVHYQDLLDGYVIDLQDRAQASSISGQTSVHCCDTLMTSLDKKMALARECLGFIDRLTEQP